MRVYLKELRMNKNLSVEQMAQLLNISQSHYYKIESGVRNPNFLLAGKIASLFDCSVDEIFFGNELDKMSNFFGAERVI